MATHNGSPSSLRYVSFGPTHQVVGVSRNFTFFLTINGDDYSGMGFDAHATAPLNGLTLANKVLNNMELGFMPNGNSGLAE
ncbi:hypothetical protein O5207_00080 [Escherichia coli]|nr:hypothetical protein [Escherichia coli]